MRKWLRRTLVLAALVAAIVVLRFTVFAPKPVPVEVVAVERGRVESTVTNSKAGTVETRLRARLSPETGGRVIALPHREGSPVKKGDVLLRIDDATQRAELVRGQRELTSARADRRRACLAAELARREYERNRQLAADGIITESLLDQSESAADTGEASCEAAAAAVDTAQATVGVLEDALRKTVLRAPFDGVVADLSIEVGEWTTPSPPALPVPPVVELIDPGSIYISAPMDEVDSARIHTGQPVRATVDSHPGESFPGTVTRVAPYVLDVEAQNRTVEIEVELDDRELASTLLPGTSADVEVILEVHDDVLRLPTPALLPGQAVLVVSDGVLERRQLEVGLRNWDYTEIRGGLAEGDEVVTSLDRPEVRAGAEVVIETGTQDNAENGPEAEAGVETSTP
jgi:HlyD family secretion protein